MSRHTAFLVALAALVAAGPLLLPTGLVTLMIYIGLSSLVGIGLVLLTGIAGLTSFGQAAFCGLAAYATALLTTSYGWSPFASLPVGLAATGLVALALGLLTVRLGGHYLVLGTLAWSLGLYYVFANLGGLGGFNGLSGLPPITIGTLSLNTPGRFYALVWGLVGLALLAAANLLDSRVGRAMRSLPAPVMAESMGVATARLKILVFVIAALLAGLSGWLQAHYIRIVNPGSFGGNASIDYLFMVVIGGTGQLGGALLGAAVVETLRTWLRESLPLLIGRSGSYELTAFGILVIAIMQNAGGGLMPLLSRVLPRRPVPTALAGAPALASRDMPARGEPLLQASGVVKRFGGLVAVNGVGFDLRAGEILGLIGPNGAGKSTLFNLLTGVATPSLGSISFRGERIDGRPSRAIAALGIARTFQHVLLRPGMTVLENAALGAHLRGRAGVIRATLRLDRAEEAGLLAEAQRQLDRVGIGELAGQPAANLALGQQRILEIARALAGNPQVLLLDEPAAGLRFAEKQRLAALLGELRGQGVSILIVEHDMDFVMNLVDRFVVVDFGEMIAEGEPAAIRADPRVIEAYLGGVDDDEPDPVPAVTQGIRA